MTELNKKYNLSEYSEKIEIATKCNDHTRARRICAKLTCNEIIIELVKAINTICKLEKQNPIPKYTIEVDRRMHEVGRKLYSIKDWNKYIWNNC